MKLSPEAQELGRLRQGVHSRNTTRRFFKDPNEENMIGAAGEVAFAKRYGLQVDTALREFGDSQVDFKTPFGTVDVKTARKPIYLFVKEKDIDKCADILVLARLSEDGQIHFVGWTRRETMRQMPVKDFGYGIRNYYCPANKLRSMDQLDDVLLF